jgi:hypothetical protein
VLLAGDRDRLARDADAYAEGALDRLQMLVVVSEQLVEEPVILELEVGAVAGAAPLPSVSASDAASVSSRCSVSAPGAGALPDTFGV